MSQIFGNQDIVANMPIVLSSRKKHIMRKFAICLRVELEVDPKGSEAKDKLNQRLGMGYRTRNSEDRKILYFLNKEMKLYTNYISQRLMRGWA